MAEDQGVNGTIWNKEANYILSWFGWETIGDIDMDVLGDDEQKYGVDTFLKFDSPVKHLPPCVILEAKSYQTSNVSIYRYNWWEASNGIGETNLLMNVRLRKIADTDLVYGKLMPLIRVSEMYLIAAECATEEQTQYDYLNAHRLRRGNQVQVTTGLEGELAKEYSKEFLCEGQLWFYYKRTNTAKIQSGSSNTNITMSNAKYVPNLPDSEIKYRN